MTDTVMRSGVMRRSPRGLSPPASRVARAITILRSPGAAYCRPRWPRPTRRRCAHPCQDAGTPDARVGAAPDARMTSMTRTERAALLRRAFEHRILVLDGAMGTMLQSRGFTADDFGGAQYEGCNEHLNLTRPDVVRDIHEGYLDAGADLISTNSFGCAPYVLAEYGLHDN